MNRKLEILVFAMIMAVLFGGCAYTTTVVNIDYTPSKYSKITDATNTIEVKHLKDIRGSEPKFLMRKGDELQKTTGQYIADRDIADIVTESLSKLLINLNYRVTPETGVLLLEGELIRYDQQKLRGFLSAGLEGAMQVNLRLIHAKNGNILWTEIVSGRGYISDLQYISDRDRKEIFEKTLDNLIENIANSAKFKQVVEKDISQ
jgi:hypothetical protein